MMKRVIDVLIACVVGCLMLASTASAAPLSATDNVYRAGLTTLNSSGARGDVYLVTDGNRLDAHIHVTGLAPNQLHAVQVRGFLDGRQSVVPAATAGFLSFDDAVASLGDRLL